MQTKANKQGHKQSGAVASRKNVLNNNNNNNTVHTC